MIPKHKYIDADVLLRRQIESEIEYEYPAADDNTNPFQEDQIHEMRCIVCFTKFASDTKYRKICSDPVCRKFRTYEYLDKQPARRKSHQIKDLIEYGFTFQEVYDMVGGQSVGHVKGIYEKFIETEMKRKHVFDAVRKKRKAAMKSD